MDNDDGFGSFEDSAPTTTPGPPPAPAPAPAQESEPHDQHDPTPQPPTHTQSPAESDPAPEADSAPHTTPPPPEPAAAPPPVPASTTPGPPSPGGFDDDDDFGDFDCAPPSTATSAQLQPTGSSNLTAWPSGAAASPAAPAAAAPPPPAPPAPPSDPDLSALSDEDFKRSVAAAWRAGSASAAAARTSTEAAQQLLDQARSRLTPADCPPGSILFHGGVPMACLPLTAPTTPLPGTTLPLRRLSRPSAAIAEGQSGGSFQSSSKGPRPLGQVYQPVVKGSSQLEWCGSASEQRLLTALGLWDIAQQVLEAEAVAAGRQYTALTGAAAAGSQRGAAGPGSVSSIDDQASEGPPSAMGSATDIPGMPGAVPV